MLLILQQIGIKEAGLAEPTATGNICVINLGLVIFIKKPLNIVHHPTPQDWRQPVGLYSINCPVQLWTMLKGKLQIRWLSCLMKFLTLRKSQTMWPKQLLWMFWRWRRMQHVHFNHVLYTQCHGMLAYMCDVQIFLIQMQIPSMMDSMLKLAICHLLCPICHFSSMHMDI